MEFQQKYTMKRSEDMKILMVSTISNTINTFLIPHIRMLIENGNKVDVAFKIEQDVRPELLELGVEIHEIPFNRKILKNNYGKLIKNVKEIIEKEQYDVVHTHTPIASAIVRFACKNIVYTKVYYTAHGFHFYKGAPFINWLTYYPIEKYLSKYTDKLITINYEDFEISKTFYAKENIYIPGVGIDLSKFVESGNIKIDYLKKELNFKEGSVVVLSIGELNKNKNHEIVIKAISKLNNPDIHYLIAGKGNLENYLLELAKDLDVKNQLHLLGFRKDIRNLLKYSDIFVFPSFREGLSVSVMEAMAMGKPVLVSKIRGNSDLIVDGKGGYLFNPQDADNLANLISIMVENPHLNADFGSFNRENIKKYSIESILRIVKKLYI